MYEFLATFEEMLDTVINNMREEEFEKLKEKIIERLNEID